MREGFQRFLEGFQRFSEDLRGFFEVFRVPLRVPVRVPFPSQSSGFLLPLIVLPLKAATEASWPPLTLRLLNALNSEDRGLKVRFSLATIVFETFELILCQVLSSQGKKRTFKPPLTTHTPLIKGVQLHPLN